MAIDPKKNVSKKLLAFPYDANRKPSSVLVLPIVESNEVVGYLPAKATNNNDGTATLDITGGGGGGASTAGVAEHHNGTATTTPSNIAFSGISKAILIDNLDTSKNLLVSFDGGTNKKTVLPEQSLSIEANHASVDVSASSGTVAFEMLVTV